MSKDTRDRSVHDTDQEKSGETEDLELSEEQADDVAGGSMPPPGTEEYQWRRDSYRSPVPPVLE